jgi:hypothetical protein
VISDGVKAGLGTLTSPWERFAPWRTVDGQAVADVDTLELSTLLTGVFEKSRFLELVRSFIVFEDGDDGVMKKLGGYHQVGAVREALTQTVRATRPRGNRKVGVVWHTQGSGKSLTMAFYAGRVIDEPAMENPTLVVITDRNDLDEQLFGTFAAARSCCARSRCRPRPRPPARAAAGGLGRRRLHHHPEVPPRRARREVPDAVGPPQRRGHRRRGPPQPVRLSHPRRQERRRQVRRPGPGLRPVHARRPAERLVHRLHRHADRADRQEHPRGVRRLHLGLRHPARGRRRRDRADLLREPPRPAQPQRGPAGRHRRRVRGGHGARGGQPARAAQVALGRARGRGRRREAPRPDRRGHRPALRAAHRGDRRQGDDRLHVAADLRRHVQGDPQAPPRLARGRRRQGRDQGHHDRLGRRRAGLAAAHPQQARLEAWPKRFRNDKDPLRWSSSATCG